MLLILDVQYIDVIPITRRGSSDSKGSSRGWPLSVCEQSSKITLAVVVKSPGSRKDYNEGLLVYTKYIFVGSISTEFTVTFQD